MSDDGRGGGFFGGFILGAIVGGVVAVLLTQEETRDLFVGKAREAGNFATDASGDFRDRVSGVTAQWQGGATDLYERGRAVVENARSNFNAAVDEGAERAREQREQLEHKAESQE